MYRGKDIQTGKPVAIKTLRPEVASGDPNALARFLREGEALRKLNHPGIVGVVAAVTAALSLADGAGPAQQGQEQLVLFYFTHNGKKTVIQVAEVTLGSDGKLRCDRNQYAAQSSEF